MDSHGNLFIADAGNECIRRVDAATQVITTVAGTLAFGTPDGDGGPATSASINDPVGVAVDRQGDLFIADVGSGSVRRVDGASGIITTVAGGGSGGDGGAATSAVLIYPAGIAIDNSGTVFTAENNRIRRVDAAAGIITTAAGNGVAGYSGDGGSAVPTFMMMEVLVLGSRRLKALATPRLIRVLGAHENPLAGRGGP